MRSPTQEFGFAFENEAENFLKQKGLKLENKNYSSKYGEIDLVMRDKDVLVFVEVRYRKLSGFGDGVDSVTKSKQKKIICAAKHYLLKHDLYDKVSCRFDVIAAAPDQVSGLLWIKNAFWAGSGGY